MMVRRAVHEDEPRILDLLYQVNGVHQKGRPDIFKRDTRKYTKEQLSQLIDDETRPIFVAVEENGYVCGYGFCVIIDTSSSNLLMPMKELYIDDLCVDENYRRKHIGKTIYDYLIQYAKDLGCYHLTLNVWACNPSAMAFYEKQGMKMLKKEMEVIL
ncbi:MAG: GNAT family N-acetyltransferase [Lachnospiraceae bacterium]|nr:GNAT family N-acetyltransferase [Lachnospiraceae bacterium]